jgi:1-acyl-sn-glycerol-3-phosphate acyltransferase
MNYKTYPRIIASEDNYKTKLSKKVSFPTTKFYLKLGKIFVGANLKTKRNIYNRYNWVATSLEVFDALESIGIEFEFNGMNNLHSIDGPVIFIANHMSMMETLILPAIIQPIKPLVFVTKKQLSTTPLFGPINKHRHPIEVGRENPREDLKTVMEVGAERIKDGRSILIFPQKTRAKFFDAPGFNTLGIKLAKRNNVPVIPIALITDAWQNGKLVKDFGKINPEKKCYIAFGKPMEITGNGSEQHSKVLEFITRKFIEWNRKDLIKA